MTALRHLTQAYARPDDRLAWLHLVLSLGLYAASLALGAWAWGGGHWLVAALATAGFAGATIRLFGIQHDCGHLSYFASHRVNVACGVLLGAVTLNPYFAMRYNHNRHHAYIGDLDRMEAHEVLTWTVAQYRAAPWWARAGYRIYRSAPVIFVLGPLFILFLRYRWPKNAARTGLADIAVQNGLMLAFWGGVWSVGGAGALAFLLMASAVTACVGVAIVYVGHNHEETYWASGPDRDFDEAALKGSSVIDLGPVFDFLTFNFAYHDLHHLNHRIPAYRLRACHRALSDHLSPTRLGLWQALGCIRWKLWDEEAGRMVPFSAARRPVPGALHPAE